MAGRIRAFDWASTPLGAVETWPQSLRALVAMMVAAPGAQAMLWGPGGILLYNDAYAQFAGERHPLLLGLPHAQAWPEIADFNEGNLRRALAGEAWSLRDVELTLDRGEGPAPLWLDIDYVPVREDEGRPAGFLAMVVETTERRVATRALKESEGRLRFLDDLTRAAQSTVDPAEILAIITRMTARHLGAEICAYADMDADQDGFTIRGDWSAPGSPSIVGHYRLADFGRMAVRELGAGRPLVVDDVVGQLDPDEAATFQALGIGATVCMPLIKEDRLLALMAVHHKAPHAWSADELATIREVTARCWAHIERVRGEIERREGEARYRTLFEAIDEGFCVIEFVDGPRGPLDDYVHVEANPAYTANAGIPDVVGQYVRQMVPDEAEGWIDLYRDVLITGKSIRFEKELEATGRWLELAAFRVEPPQRNQVAVLFKDLTERKRAELALERLNATLEARVAEALADRKLFADIIRSADAFVQVVDLDGRWLAVNESSADEFERIFGVRPVVGMKMSDTLSHLPEQAAAVEAIWAKAIAHAPFVEVQEFGDPRRDRRFYEMRYYPLLDAAGAKIGAYQIVYDVTDRLAEQARLREAEEALRQSQKMEAVGQLTGGIAHDFNNLLAGISGSLELLGKRLAEGRTSGMERYIEAAQGAAQRAASLTQRLLAFSRRQTLDPRPTDMNRLIGGMEDLIRRSVGPNVEVEVVGAGGLWTTRVDRSQLENALLNLCVNARDAMGPGGGRLTIETANKWLDERHARERDLSPGQYVSLCVTDTGSGMDAATAERIFDPFFTTKPIGQGTGLGLSMIHGFVRQSGGQVRVYSEVGKGTTMCLYLPRWLGEAEDDVAPPASDDAAPGHGEVVLVVDDEPTVRMLVLEVLREGGYRALEAGDGPTALRILETDARIDLLITDVGLPGGMNGRQVADAARLLRPGLKTLFITGYAENAAVGNGLLEPGMEVMTKPFVMHDLAAKVTQMIDAPAGP